LYDPLKCKVERTGFLEVGGGGGTSVDGQRAIGSKVVLVMLNLQKLLAIGRYVVKY
jgi:hypothetical protein